MTDATPSGSVTLQVIVTWLADPGVSGECLTCRMFGAAFVAKTELIAPGVGMPLRQELPRLLSSAGFASCIDGPSPFDAIGQGNSDLKSTSSMTSSKASRKVMSSPSLLSPPTQGPNAPAAARSYSLASAAGFS